MELTKLFYSKRESAELLSVSEHVIAKDVQRGNIAAKHYGRRVLIPREELLRIAREGMRSASGARA
jgi:excisionase family DNA binding protein